MNEVYPFRTLPDYLRSGLDVILIGVNPGTYSVDRGHYFARRTNRFWTALSRSRLSAPIRRALGRDELGPEDDAVLPEFGIGLTDVVKVPSRSLNDLPPALFAAWSPRLLLRLARHQPRVACFQGMVGFRAFARHALDVPKVAGGLGEQPYRIAATRVFVVPNPSPANAHFRLEDQVAWYDRLADFLRDPA
ncbi:MAG TPA: mismatch-specific DNA-glycosylase [Dehalococcoidia bacterium]|nr:mismatch-specific DNA-glycosylase [Dehalococcoidia bacterium]